MGAGAGARGQRPADRSMFRVVFKVRPSRHCPPPYRVPINSINEGSKFESMTWRSIPAWP